jgi:hypothetical protein
VVTGQRLAVRLGQLHHLLEHIGTSLVAHNADNR